MTFSSCPKETSLSSMRSMGAASADAAGRLIQDEIRELSG